MQLYKQSRYKGFKRIEYETVKIDDIINFLESEDCKKWLNKNKDKPSKINPSLTYQQVYDIFFNGSKASKEKGNEFESSIVFKNFKRIWGKQITFIDV